MIKFILIPSFFTLVSSYAFAAQTITIDFTDRLEIRRLSFDEFEFFQCHFHACYQVGPAKTYSNAEMKAALDLTAVVGSDKMAPHSGANNGSISAEFLNQTQRDQAATVFVMGKIAKGQMAVTDDWEDPKLKEFLDRAANSKNQNAYVRENVDDVTHLGSWGCPSFCDSQFLEINSYVGPYSEVLSKISVGRGAGRQNQKQVPSPQDDILQGFVKSL